MDNNDYAHDLQNVNACLTPRCYTRRLGGAAVAGGCMLCGEEKEAGRVGGARQT